MGIFGGYTGSMYIPEEKKDEFAGQVAKILNYGGMMQFESISMYGHDMALLKPIELYPGGKVYFHFNYFEDDVWETAGFDAADGYFHSEKIGGREFCDVVTAVHFLYEAWDEGPGFAEINGDIVNERGYTGWINHLLGTRFSMKKRFRLWNNVETYVLGQLEDDEDLTVGMDDVMQFIPVGMRYASGGTELSDLMYIIHGTDSLSEEETEPGTYPADIYGCRKALEEFFEMIRSEDAVRQVLELVRKNRHEREKLEDTAISDIGRFSLILPARVIVYLTAELKKENFWKIWKDVHETVYHDEIMKEYASQQLKEERKRRAEAAVPSVRTSEFLRQDGFFVFSDTPEELQGRPNYYISDDDRLYWWDGTDEVIISEEVDEWLKGLAVQYKKTLKDVKDIIEKSGGSDAFFKGFLELLVEIDQYYKRIYPFQSMFYEFIQNGDKAEYRAAVKLLKEIADENRAEGRIIEKVKYSWDLTSRNVTHNIGRLRLKRFLSVMANRKLRKQYFEF